MPLGPSELDLALEAVGATPPALPPELPVAHLTVARWLTPILKAGALFPRRCAVFGEKLLYFSYGGVFFRPKKHPTENAAELPVGMVFTPEVLDTCARLFPFDSGAMKERLFGDQWFQALHPFDQRFAITKGRLSNAARVLVRSVYADNKRYLEGRPIKNPGSAPAALQVLHEFLSQDFSAAAVDHRHRSIEALTKTTVTLGENLQWMGLPLRRLPQVKQALREQTRRLPIFYSYSYSRNHSPDAIAELLQRKAYEDLIKGSYER